MNANQNSHAEPSTSSTGDWIDEFLELTKDINSPRLFLKWSAIMAIAGALERRVWVRIRKRNLYPNLYVFFVAPPAVGKGQAMFWLQKLWEGLEDQYVASTNITKAALIDELAEAIRRHPLPNEFPPYYEYNSLKVFSDELGSLLPTYDNAFMNILVALYDNGSFSEKIRSRENRINIPRSNLNMIAACQPAYLSEFLPVGAWDQGFMSRVIMIYSGEQEKREIFTDDEHESEGGLVDPLLPRLKEIGELYGKFEIEPDAQELLRAWYMGGEQPMPDHPRLTNYCGRRLLHLLKLTMVCAVSAGRGLLITKADAERGLELLTEAEFFMPDVFKAMNSGGDGQLIEEAFHYIYTMWIRNQKKPVQEHRLAHFLQERTPAHNVVKIIDVMERSKIIKKEFTSGGTCYVPTNPPKS